MEITVATLRRLLADKDANAKVRVSVGNPEQTYGDYPIVDVTSDSTNYEPAAVVLLAFWEE